MDLDGFRSFFWFQPSTSPQTKKNIPVYRRVPSSDFDSDFDFWGFAHMNLRVFLILSDLGIGNLRRRDPGENFEEKLFQNRSGASLPQSPLSLCSTLFNSALLYSTLLHSILLASFPLYSSLLFFTLTHSTAL